MDRALSERGHGRRGQDVRPGSLCHYEVAQTMRGGAFRKEIGRPTWKRLDRASVEVIVGAKV